MANSSIYNAFSRFWEHVNIAIDERVPTVDGTVITSENFTSYLIPNKITLTATAGQAAFTIPFDYNSDASNLTVFFNGLLLKEGDNYAVNTDNNSVNLIGFTAEAGDIIAIHGIIGAGNVDFDQAAIDAIEDIQEAKSSAISEISAKEETAVNRINNLTQSLPDGWDGYATVEYVDNKVANVVSGVWHAGASAPSNTKLLWIDTGTTDPGLKYYNGSAWVTVPVRWS